MNMKLAMMALALALAAPVAASAQPGEPATNTAAFLERRIPDELAADGVLLSRRGLSLKVEQRGSAVTLSLIDVDTGRSVASTKIEHLPEDRDAMVASVTQVVANLVAESAPGKPEHAGRAAPRAPALASEDDGLAARQRTYRQQAIHFDELAVITGNQYGISTSLSSLPRRGEMNELIETEDFFRIVGRDDLADHYLHRQHVGKVVAVVGGLAVLGGSVAMIASVVGSSGGNINDSLLIGGGVVAGVGTIVMPIGIFVYATANPVGANEAKSMAAQYNAQLRQRLHLPEAQRSLVHDVRLASYGAPDGAGLALSGHF